MKFRIVRYYDRYKAQALNGNEYVNIGSPTGYATVTEARLYCTMHKACEDSKVVEEFEL